MKKEEKEVVFYEFSDFRYFLLNDKRLSKNTVDAYYRIWSNTANSYGNIKKFPILRK